MAPAAAAAGRPSSAVADRRRPRPSSPASTSARRLRAVGLDRLVGIVAALAEVLRLDVADVQKAVAADAEIDERRLDARLQVDDRCPCRCCRRNCPGWSARRTALRATPSSTIAIRHSSGCATLISISCFMSCSSLSVFVRLFDSCRRAALLGVSESGVRFRILTPAPDTCMLLTPAIPAELSTTLLSNRSCTSRAFSNSHARARRPAGTCGIVTRAADLLDLGNRGRASR